MGIGLHGLKSGIRVFFIFNSPNTGAFFSPHLASMLAFYQGLHHLLGKRAFIILISYA